MNRKQLVSVTLTAAAVTLAMGIQGCASKGFVRDRIDELSQANRADIDALQADAADLRNSSEDALERARSAGDAADEARELALGRAGLEEVNRYTVYFAFNSDAIDDAARATLDGAAGEIGDHPEAIVDVYGFADARGSDRYNLELGQRRAMEVLRYLAGSNPHQLSRYAAVSFGEREVDALPREASDDAHSRRVVVSLIRRIPIQEKAPSSAAVAP